MTPVLTLPPPLRTPLPWRSTVTGPTPPWFEDANLSFPLTQDLSTDPPTIRECIFSPILLLPRFQGCNSVPFFVSVPGRGSQDHVQG